MIAPEASWRVIGASVCGTSHLRTGHGCDDAHAYRLCNNGTLLLAIADGAGSAAQAARGAAIVAQVAMDSAEQTINGQPEPAQADEWRDLLIAILSAARHALEQLALEHSASSQDIDAGEQEFESTAALPLRDFATTLLVAIVTQHWIALAQVGDGIMVVQADDGAVHSLTAQHEREFINVTNFVSDADYLTVARYIIRPRTETTGVALLTDGLELLAVNYPDNTAYQPFFIPLFRFAGSSDATEDELRDFLESERVCERTDDDKTLLLAVYR